MNATNDNTAVVGRRIAQYIVDWLLIAIVGAALLALYLLSPTKQDGAVDSTAAGFWVITAFVFFGGIVWSLYVWVLRPYSHDGQTIGMGIMSIQVVSVDGSAASRGQLLVRALLFFVDIGMTPLIGLISMLASARNQRIGDHVAKTIVRSI
jgi:uncharacterized RDD family membrane protein YckC